MGGFFSNGAWVEIPIRKSKPIVLEDIERRLSILEEINGSSSRIHADINVRGTSLVIVCGVLNGRDYVSKFEVPNSSLPEIIAILKELNRVIKMGYVDTPFNRPWMI